MRPAENIEKLVKNINIDTNAKTDKAVLGDVIEAFEKSKNKKSASTQPNIWRIIMKSPITKLAVAVVIIVAVILGLTITGGPDIASVTWAEVIEKVEQIPALSFDMTTELSYTEQNEKLSLQSENYVAGDYGTKSSIYMNGELFVLKYRLPKKNLAYQIRPKDKTYICIDLSDEQAAKGQDPDDPRTWLKMILSGDYTKLGHTNIDGIDVEGIESSNPEILGGDEGVMRLWVDVETSLPVRIEVEVETMADGKKRPHKFVMVNFKWNVEFDESVFEPNIPNDYKLREEQREEQKSPQQVEQKPPRLVTDTDKDEQPMVKEVVRKLLQTCANKNWEEFSDLWPGLSLNKMQKIYLGGLEIIQIGEPFKTDDSATWYVPYQIKLKLGEVRKKNLRVRYDETTKRFVACGGL